MRRGHNHALAAREGLLAVIPVKPLPVAKTRLRGAVPDTIHSALVLAMARDTVAAVLACPLVDRVLVVSDDQLVRDAVTALGAHCVPDEPDAGLNAAIAFGAGGTTGPIAVLTADLPALRPDDLTEALTAAAAGGRFSGYVPDADGTGTVLLTAASAAALTPRFGPGSAAAHQAAGVRRLEGAWPSLRRDVDTAADLDRACELGLGTFTEDVLCAIAFA